MIEIQGRALPPGEITNYLDDGMQFHFILARLRERIGPTQALEDTRVTVVRIEQYRDHCH